MNIHHQLVRIEGKGERISGISSYHREKLLFVINARPRERRHKKRLKEASTFLFIFFVFFFFKSSSVRPCPS